MSILSFLRRTTTRSLVHYALNAHRRGGRASDSRAVARAPLSTLDARIAARVAREKANGTYDYIKPTMVKLPRRAAVKRNGGLRGSKATRWR